MANFATLIHSLNDAAKRGRTHINISTNKFSLSIIESLYKHQFISSFSIQKNNNLTTIFFRYRGGHCAFSEFKLFSSPSRMLSMNFHKIKLVSKKCFQEYFFFTTPQGIKVYTFFDLLFLKDNISLGFLLFSVRT